MDRQRQEAYNLFLGNYTFAQGEPMLWDLATDYYLHHADPKAFSANIRKTYARWYNAENLQNREVLQHKGPKAGSRTTTLNEADDYWLEHYRPLTMTSFAKLLPYKMNSTPQHTPLKFAQDGDFDRSPFKVRHVNDSGIQGPVDEVASLAAKNAQFNQLASDEGSGPKRSSELRQATLPGWLHKHLHDVPRGQRTAIDKSPLNPTDPVQRQEVPMDLIDKSYDKATVVQLSLGQCVDKSLNPTVSKDEAHEYERYVKHPMNLTLAASQAVQTGISLDFSRYVGRARNFEWIYNNPSDADSIEFSSFVQQREDPLTVTEADTEKKRYKAYRQWLKGKSLFKQQRVEL